MRREGQAAYYRAAVRADRWGEVITMGEAEIGRVHDYFARIGVAGIELIEAVAVGDRIRIVGHTTDLTLTVESMQVEHEAVERAEAGASIGLKVEERCRRGDRVYKVSE